MALLQTNLLLLLKLADVTKQKKSLLRKISWLRNPSGSSVVTDGLMISDSVVLTMFLLVDVISTLWYSIQKFILTQVDSLPSLHLQVLSLSSLQAVKLHAVEYRIVRDKDDESVPSSRQQYPIAIRSIDIVITVNGLIGSVRFPSGSIPFHIRSPTDNG